MLGLVITTSQVTPGSLSGAGESKMKSALFAGESNDVNPMDPSVFGYIRVSQAEGESGLATQRRTLNDHGLRDDRIFTDVASGRNMRRPSWKELRDMLKPGDTVVVPRIDRLARNLTEDSRPSRRCTARTSTSAR